MTRRNNTPVNGSIDLSVDPDQFLHAAAPDELEERIVARAMAATGAVDGGLFLWDEAAQALAIDFHVVEGLRVRLPHAVLHRRTDGRPNGIAMWVLENNTPYLCNDTARDPYYAPYFVDVASIAAVPIDYQHRVIGVITVSKREVNGFSQADVVQLEELANSAAKFIRRAALFRASERADVQPFLIKGISPEWVEVERRIENVAPADTPVLITGESGTGKDLVARAIHFNSRRSDSPFVTVNCAAIPETMLESILFGHLRGAFTGATFTKIGEFQRADGGTLFLDEVGEMPMALQAKVLRAVEQGEVQSLGSNKPPERVDVRVMCATNRRLEEMVRDGQFRDDLYYRLSVMPIELPPLRSYKDNLSVLAQVFLQQAAQGLDRRAPRLSAAALALLRAYDFPGNVRELKNAIEHAVLMADGDEIGVAALPGSIRAGVHDEAEPLAARRTLQEMREAWLAPLERQYLSDLLRECDGNVREAARRAGVNPVTLYRLFKKRGLRLRRDVAAVES